MAEMEYLRKLVAAADFVLVRDRDAPALDPAEFGVSASLKPHQVEGVSWLVRRYLLGANAILGDEMGLGKTLQALSFLSYLKIKFSAAAPSLILCPLSVTDGWSSEFAKFCPTLKVLKYVGDKDFRLDLRKSLYEHVTTIHSSEESPCLPFDVLLTTYDIALLDQDFLSQIPWQFCIVDEAQRLKNPSSVLYNVLENRFIMPRRLLMTGTPIQNNLSELWSLMHFCLPSIFGTLEQFLSAFKNVELSHSDNEGNGVAGRFRTLKYIVKAFMLRRTKNMLIERGVLVLPSLTEMTVLIPLTSLQKKVYASILRKELPKLLAFSGAVSHQSLQNIVIQLRKACSHPYLFSGIEPEPFEEGEHLIQASGKLIFLDLLLQKLKASGHRVLLFAQMTRTLDILQDFLELRKFTYERLDGSVRAEERFAAIRSFSSKSAENKMTLLEDEGCPFVFIISTRAGGVGLNLVAADTVIFYEQDWNPQVDKQALQRAHRIGQTSSVLAISLVTELTVEEVIMRRAEKKLQLTNKVVGEVGDLERGKVGSEVGDMQSLIFGLRFFDPTSINDDNASSLNVTKLNKMSDKVLEMRYHEASTSDKQRFEVNSTDFFNKDEFSTEKYSNYIGLDQEVDEAAYQSWIEKFKEVSTSTDVMTEQLGRRRSEPLDEQQKLEKERQAKEKRLAKWETLGYKSLAVELPIRAMDSDVMEDSGHVEFVYGDCTKPSTVCPSEPAIIFSYVDNSGVWGRGGMFDALSSLSDDVPNAYRRAAEFKDLHLGDLHLIKITGSSEVNASIKDSPQWVALAVVQSYSSRRKVPRSNISMDALEECVSKASFTAVQYSASLHMPRIGYRDGSLRSEWYTVERLLRKYSSLFGVRIFVHYFCRVGKDKESSK